jgi:hypothetical protein
MDVWMLLGYLVGWLVGWLVGCDDPTADVER